MQAFILALAVAAMMPVFADPPPAETLPPQRCPLNPINPWKFQYSGCRDTTDYKTLNRYLALNLGPSREFDQYRLYRGAENKILPVSTVVVMAFLCDIAFTRYMKGLCIESFNSNCPGKDRVTSLLPLAGYLAATGITVPLSAFTSYQRIRYLRLLVGQYNESFSISH